jgi:CRP-like cAMP-binding protein
MENELFSFLEQYMPLNPEEKQIISDLSLFKSYKKGAILLKAGTVSNEYYFVLKGCLRIFYLIDGEERTTAFFTEFESCSPLCTVNHQPSKYYVACVEDSVLLVANTAMEKVVFEKFPRFETLCRIMSEQLLAKNQASFDNFKNSSPEQRYLNLLETRPDLINRVPQHQLASFLGMKPESLSRIRKRIVKTSRALVVK